MMKEGTDEWYVYYCDPFAVLAALYLPHPLKSPLLVTYVVFTIHSVQQQKEENVEIPALFWKNFTGPQCLGALLCFKSLLGSEAIAKFSRKYVCRKSESNRIGQKGTQQSSIFQVL